MKGFDIEIKNNLLEPKHIEAMNQSVWLYMWLVDKMTSVNEDGIGLVLGGKPIKYSEVKAELGISKNTYSRWIDKLLSYPYIVITRTPYGIVFRVLKAHKRFKNRITTNGESTSLQVVNLSPENGEPNKTVSVDNTIDNNTANENVSGNNHKEVFEYFKNRVTESCGIAPMFNGKKDGPLVKRSLQKFPIEEVKKVIDFYLEGEKIENHGYNLSVALSADTINRYLFRTKQLI